MFEGGGECNGDFDTGQDIIQPSLPFLPMSTLVSKDYHGKEIECQLDRRRWEESADNAGYLQRPPFPRRRLYLLRGGIFVVVAAFPGMSSINLLRQRFFSEARNLLLQQRKLLRNLSRADRRGACESFGRCVRHLLALFISGNQPNGTSMMLTVL